MTTVRYAFIPACIIFGPLFMTRLGGMLQGRAGDSLVFLGPIMLAAGLYLMLGIIVDQQKTIDRLIANQETGSAKEGRTI